MSTITEIEVGGVPRKIEDAQARDDVRLLLQQTNGLYKGRNLAEIFNGEISRYSDPWEWIHDRIDMGFYDGIYVCDFIPHTVKNERVESQIACLDGYTRTTDQNLGHHIDFISRDCFSETVQWNTTNNNNGNAESPYPYMVSNLHKWLEETLYGYLPENVKKHIVTKRSLMEQRYSASGALTDSTSWGWQDIGKLWVPHEYEVFGAVVWGTQGWSEGQAMQYPIFANSYLNRIKGAGHGGSRCAWWLASVRSGDSTDACLVDSYGNASYWGASNALRVPLCFRITAKAA